ncbi:MAG: DUF5658 family protein [Promethearchaeota archaeon]|jgi:hypothetical protein
MELDILRHLNYWVLGVWSVLRILDYIFSAVALSLGLATEANPFVILFGGINIYIVLFGFIPIIGLIIVNYKNDIKSAGYFIFIGGSVMMVIQVIATLVAMFGYYI